MKQTWNRIGLGKSVEADGMGKFRVELVRRRVSEASLGVAMVDEVVEGNDCDRKNGRGFYLSNYP